MWLVFLWLIGYNYLYQNQIHSCMTLFSMQGVNVKCLSLESLCRLLPTVRHNPVVLRGEIMTRQHEGLHITCALSYPALYPDSTPDCHPGRGKATVLTGQRRHCNPSSHRPAFISFGLSQPAILTAWPDLCGRGEYPVLVAPSVVTLP